MSGTGSNSGPAPRLQQAERVAERLAEDVVKWRAGKQSRPGVLVHGPVGAGKSSLLSYLCEHLAEGAIPFLRLSPPELALDSATHLVDQTAGSLRAHRVNGVLEPVFQLEVDPDTKLRCACDALDSIDPSVVVIDLPESWRALEEDDDAQKILKRAPAAAEQLMFRASAKHAVIAAAPRGWSSPEGWQIETLKVQSDGASLLREQHRWGPLASMADRLAAALGDAAAQRSPLELRISVALVALGRTSEAVASACRYGARRLFDMLADELRRRPPLARVFLVLSQARYPLPQPFVDDLLAQKLKHDDYRDVLRHALLLWYAPGWLVHPSLRGVVARRPNDHRLLHTMHAKLMACWPAPGAIESREAAIAGHERLFHAAKAGLRDVVCQDAWDTSLLLTLGKALSQAGRYAAAVDVYERALEVAPGSAYCTEYLAYNLERLGRDPKRAESLFKAAVEGDPSNPWWNRRYITALIRRGKIREARRAWIDAWSRLDESGGSEQLPVATTPWLARNFHVGILRELLNRAELVLAFEVVSTLPASVVRENTDLIFLVNRLEHMREADELEASIFPVEVPFQTRWDRPYLATETPLADLASWYPGQVVEIDDVVTLRLGERSSSGSVRVFETEMTRDDFLDAANRRHLEGVFVGQFLEVLVTTGGETRIYLRSKTRPDPQRVAFDLLRPWHPGDE